MVYRYLNTLSCFIVEWGLHRDLKNLFYAKYILVALTLVLLNTKS